MIEVFLSPAWVAATWMLAARAARARTLDLGAPNLPYLFGVAAGSTMLMLLRVVPLHSALALDSLAVAAYVDARCGYVFDSVVVSGLLVVLPVALAEAVAPRAVLGAVTAAGALFVVWAASRGRGLGLGDVKLAAVLGTVFGPSDGIVTLGLSFVLGGVVASGLLMSGKARLGTPVCFGPYLLAGSLCFLAYHRLSNGVIR